MFKVKHIGVLCDVVGNGGAEREVEATGAKVGNTRVLMRKS
jgi:hypothetical protein